jgi:hypothetical protein
MMSVCQMRNVRYIGELVKFRVAPPIVPFNVLKTCLDNFTNLNVEVRYGPSHLAKQVASW